MNTAADERIAPDPTEIGAILHLLLQWLEPHDLARAAQVCRRWNKGTKGRLGEIVWKQSALGVSSKESMKALEGALTHTRANKRLKLDDYKTIARGYALKGKAPSNLPPTPELRAEDLFLLLELKSHGVTQSICKSMKECVSIEDEAPYVAFSTEEVSASPTTFQLKEQNPTDWDNFDVGRQIMDDMEVTMSLWRRDTGQSVFLPTPPRGKLHNKADLSIISFFWDNAVKVRPTGMSYAALLARSVCSEKGIHYFNPEINLELQPVLPSAELCNPEEKWLNRLRQEGRLVFDDWKNDTSFQSHSKDFFRYRLTNAYVIFVFSEDPDSGWDDGAVSSDNFLFFLQGLDWK